MYNLFKDVVFIFENINMNNMSSKLQFVSLSTLMLFRHANLFPIATALFSSRVHPESSSSSKMAPSNTLKCRPSNCRDLATVVDTCYAFCFVVATNIQLTQRGSERGQPVSNGLGLILVEAAAPTIEPLQDATVSDPQECRPSNCRDLLVGSHAQLAQRGSERGKPASNSHGLLLVEFAPI